MPGNLRSHSNHLVAAPHAASNTSTAIGRGSRQAVAVAYFGAGASRLLPFPKGSRLVVDASERTVASGQTCPADLLKLVKKGVAVYSVPNLHAKVFVLGRAAYIGSANVSKNSARLVEAMIRTTMPSAVRAALRFVQDHCLHELTPTILKRLTKLYRPPHVPGGQLAKQRNVSGAPRPKLPRLLLAQLDLVKLSEREQALNDSALAVAAKRRKHPRRFELDSFLFTGACPYARDDVVIMITDEGRGKVLVSPPGNVLHVRGRRDGNRQVSFVCLEHPIRRRRPIKSLARALGHGALKRLHRQGLIRDASFAQALLNEWTR
jgi:hypothetical protein